MKFSDLINQGRRPEIDSATSAITSKGYPYYYLWPYIPKRFAASEEEQHIRQIIYGFKDGRYHPTLLAYVMRIATEIQKKCFNSSNDVYLCIIPASTAEKTNNRFNKFCADMCTNSGLKNGYSLIGNKEDREAKHLAEDGGADNISKYLVIGDVKNKNIILLDDVITRGRSFNQTSDELKAAGATKIIGLFLGKTTWKEEQTLTLG